MTFAHGITVTFTPDQPTDEHGDPTGDEPDDVEVDGCGLAPRTGEEVDGKGRDGIVEDVTLFAPYGSAVDHAGTVVVTDGPHAGTYRVEGEPGHWRSPFSGREHGVQIPLRRAEG